MPHFIIECSSGVLEKRPPEEVIQAVFEAASSTELFAKSGSGGIKVRVLPFEHYTVVGTQDDFIHVAGHIMEGRSIPQKKDLSMKIIAVLKGMFPDVPIISMDVREFEKASYSNKGMV